MNLLSPNQVDDLLLKDAACPQRRSLPLRRCAGRILAENIFADRDQPSAERSSMDGIALCFSALKAGRRVFKIAGTQKAGIPAKQLQGRSDCFEIMTGALLPLGCNCVIPIEHILISGTQAVLKEGFAHQRGQFIRKRASEYQEGDLLLSKGTYLRSAQIGLAANVGKSTVHVFAPRIAIIGTGDELVAINRPVKPFQSRRSNAESLSALLASFGFPETRIFHFNDHADTLRRRLRAILADFDIVILSGGVSMGKFDLIPQVLKELGVTIAFHKVSQRPGKPLLFGRTPTHRPVFALPGNPVSTLVCARRYIIPYLQNACGHPARADHVLLKSPQRHNAQLTLFLPVQLRADGYAHILATQGSGDTAALARSDGFVEIPRGRAELNPRKRVRFWPWH